MADWRPWHFSSTNLIHDIPEDLRPGADGENLVTVPKHDAMGASLGDLANGRTIDEGTRRSPGPFGQDYFLRQLDSSGDGVADTFVSTNPRDRNDIRSVSIGAPADSDRPRTTFYGSGGSVDRVVVVGEQGVKETYYGDGYRRVDGDGRSVRAYDFDGDGQTDTLKIGRHPSANAHDGWPYVGYSPND